MSEELDFGLFIKLKNDEVTSFKALKRQAARRESVNFKSALQYFGYTKYGNFIEDA